MDGVACHAQQERSHPSKMMAAQYSQQIKFQALTPTARAVVQAQRMTTAILSANPVQMERTVVSKTPSVRTANRDTSHQQMLARVRAVPSQEKSAQMDGNASPAHLDQVSQMQTVLAVSHALPGSHPQMMDSVVRSVLADVCTATARQGPARHVVLVLSRATTALHALNVLVVQLVLVASARLVSLERNQTATRLLVSLAWKVQLVLSG